MRRVFVFLFLLLWCIVISAQTVKSVNVDVFLSDLNKTSKHGVVSDSDFLKKYPITFQNNVMYVSVLAKTCKGFDEEKLKEIGIYTGSTTTSFATLRIPLEFFENPMEIPGVCYIEIAAKFAPALDKARRDSRVDSVHMGWNLPLPITGKNVIIGFTDWGFDYTHPMFYDTMLTETRILAAWDQFRNEGPAPAGFNYGTVFSGSSQLLNAQCDTFNIYEYATHGSHVAGIAAGSGAGTIYRGVAFDAELLFATFLIDAAAVVDAFAWMKQFAENEGKRLVINMSWGLYYMGNMDGTSILSQMINQMSDDGVVFVSSAGNNGDVNFHLKKNFNTQPDTLKTIIKFDSYTAYPKMWGQCITMWGMPDDSFAISLKILDAQNQLLEETPFYSTNSALSYSEHEIIIGNDTVFYNMAAETANPFNKRPHFSLRVRNTKTADYKVALYALGENTTVHFWNVIELVNGVGNWGSPFQALTSGWTAGDPYYGIGEPTCAESVITVAAHNSQITLGNNTIVNGNIAGFSSYGPLMTEEVKPDISAPGMSVCSSISSFTSMSIPPMNVVTTVNFNGRDYKFVRFSGTSMSSPHVAGVVALLLEANPLLTPAEIKQILRNSARQDDKTGIIPPSGSPRWGWGKLNALLALYYALNIQHINEPLSDIRIEFYPNPATDELHIRCDQFYPTQLYVFSINGKQQAVYSFQSDEAICLNIQNYAAGTYIVFLFDGNNWKADKFMKQ